MKKLYIITGANGFLGNNIIRKLEQNRESEIRALVLPNDSIKSLEKLNCKIYYMPLAYNCLLKVLYYSYDIQVQALL